MAYFRDIVGHEMTVSYLRGAIRSGNISHAYLISGAPGSGKKLIAEAFAQALLCERGGDEACGECRSCKKFMGKNHPDVIRVVHERPATIRVDEIREQVIEDAAIRPYDGGKKIYIIDEAEKMNTAAQNAILKTLEEPPDYAVLLLLTTNASIMLETIRSRCVLLPLRPVPDKTVRSWLMEKMEVPAETLPVLGATALVAVIPVPASPSGGQKGIPAGSRPPVRRLPSSVSFPASSPATRTLVSRMK